MTMVYYAPCGYRCGNAGDMVAALLAEHVLGHPVTLASPEEATLTTTGSILHHLPETYSGVIWGSGLMFRDMEINLPNADIRCVRGPLTAARVNGGLGPEVALGDAALLANELPFPWSREKRYTVGVIPHYMDIDNEVVKEWLVGHPGTTSIDICGRVPDVLRAITECQYILSSSLHGLIFADALGVPSAWIVLSDLIAGGEFKFRDYYAVFGISPNPFPFHANMYPAEILGYPWDRQGLDDIRGRLKECLLR